MLLLTLKCKTQIACTFFFFLATIVNAQVGIGTITPNAALDVVAGANNYGLLMPRVALTATNISAPVKNPVTGAFLTNTVAEIGTMIFNTNTTAGTYGVIPGIYFWDGTNWVSQVHRYFDTKFAQNANLTVATTASTYTNIPNLNAKSFVAPYTGKYSISFTGYLGAGTVDLDSGKVGFVEGNFKLTVNAIDYRKYTHSTSFYNSNTTVDYLELFNETNINITISLNAGQTCNLNASYWGVADDNITEANPHVIGNSTALGNYSEINVMYIGR